MHKYTLSHARRLTHLLPKWVVLTPNVSKLSKYKKKKEKWKKINGSA